MTQTIQLSSGGTAEFTNEFIQIDDETEKRNYWVFLFSTLIWIPTSILFLASEDFDFSRPFNWVWLFVLVAHLIVGPLRILRTSFQETVWLDEVASAKVSTGYKDATLTLKLKNGKRRSIQAKYDYAKDFRAYIQANLYGQRR